MERRRELTWVGVTAVVAGAAGTLAAGAPEKALHLLPLALPILLLAWATRAGRISAPVLSPVWIVVLTLLAVGAGGYLFAADLVDAGGASVRISLTDEISERALGLFLQLSLWVTVGALLVAFNRPAAPRVLGDISFSPSARSWFLAAAALPGLVLIAGTRGELLYRSTYLPSIEGTSSAGLAGTLAIGAVVLLGYLAGSERGLRRLLAVALAAGYLLMFFSIGSRRLAMVPLLFALGLCAWQGTRRRGRVIFAGGLTALLLLPIPLWLRGASSHGLYPYLDRLALFSYGDVDWLTATNNVLIAYPIAAATAFIEPSMPRSWLFIELNPAPGTMAGWYEIAGSVRLNFFTPYSAVGELGNFGPVITAAVGIGFGLALGFIDGRVRHYIHAGQAIYGLALLGLTALFAVTMLQYNLRSSVRLVLYAVALDIVIRVVRSRRSTQANSRRLEVVRL